MERREHCSRKFFTSRAVMWLPRAVCCSFRFIPLMLFLSIFLFVSRVPASFFCVNCYHMLTLLQSNINTCHILILQSVFTAVCWVWYCCISRYACGDIGNCFVSIEKYLLCFLTACMRTEVCVRYACKTLSWRRVRN